MNDALPSKERVADTILSEAIDCCRSWEPEVRLIGNVRAIDLRDLLLELWKHRNVPASTPEPPAVLPEGFNAITDERLAQHLEVTCSTTLRSALTELQIRRAAQPPAPEHARPLSEWSEAQGPVVWWAPPVREPSYIGQPGDSDWPGYHTYWTPHPKVPSNIKEQTTATKEVKP